jgi:hypothetical protein
MTFWDSPFLWQIYFLEKLSLRPKYTIAPSAAAAITTIHVADEPIFAAAGSIPSLAGSDNQSYRPLTSF